MTEQLLAVDAYTDQGWYEREQETLFERVWSFAGMTEDLQAPGDYVCIQVGRCPLFVVRDGDGALRAFHNLCRHRGSQLLEGSGNAGRNIRCFYHRWTYDLEGRLVGVPQRSAQFPELNVAGLGLHPAGIAVWRDLIFVHAEPEPAQPLDAWLGSLPDKLGPHRFEKLVEVARIRYRVRANWKLLIENFIDGYHFFHLHAETLGSGDFTRQAWEPAGRHWAFYRPLKPGVSFETSLLPVVDGVPPDFGADADVVFPNLALYGTATLWLTFHVIPLAPDLSSVDVRTRAMPGAIEDPTPSTSDVPRSQWIEELSGPLARYFVADPALHPLDSKDVMLEDIYACEAMQRGMRSPRYRVGPMSRDYESALPVFQRNVLDYVEKTP